MPAMKLMTASETAAYLGITYGTLANYRSLGIGPRWSKKKSHQGGPARVFYDKSDVDRWKSQQACPTCGHVRVHRGEALR